MRSSAPIANVLSAQARRDPVVLARAARNAEAAVLARAWPRLSAPCRAAAFASLSAAAAARLFARLSFEDRWLAYLGSISNGAAPLFDGKPAAARRVLRRRGRAELEGMRRALAGGRA